MGGSTVAAATWLPVSRAAKAVTAAWFSEPLPLIEAKVCPDVAMASVVGAPLLRAELNSLPTPPGAGFVKVIWFRATKPLRDQARALAGVAAATAPATSAKVATMCSAFMLVSGGTLLGAPARVPKSVPSHGKRPSRQMSPEHHRHEEYPSSAATGVQRRKCCFARKRALTNNVTSLKFVDPHLDRARRTALGGNEKHGNRYLGFKNLW